MKLDKNDRSNNSFILAENFCHLRLSAPLHVKNHEKNLCKIRAQSSLLKLIANVQSDNSFLNCSKLTQLELSALASNV